MTLFRVLAALISLSILGLICTYVYRRLVRDTTTHRGARIAATVALMTPVIALPFARLGFATEAVPYWLNRIVLSLMGFVLFTMLCLLVLDLVRWVSTRRLKAAPVVPDAQLNADENGGRLQGLSTASERTEVENPERRLFLSRAVAATALTVGGATSVYGAYRALTPPQITEVPIKLPFLPKALEGFTIVQLSDIHVGAMIQEKFLDVLVEGTNGCKPDLIAITGDLVDGSPGQLGRYVARFQNLRAPHGVYFCSGNHDYYSGWEEWAAVLPGIGFNLLRNRRVEIGDAGASFDLMGVEDLGARWGAGEYDLEKAVKGRDPQRASVLMAHQPSNLDAVAAKRIGLQLSGHTHGGQVFPATVIGSLIWGNRNAGLSKYDGTWQFTSRGCGFVGVPMRVGSPPEIVKIVLTT